MAGATAEAVVVAPWQPPAVPAAFTAPGLRLTAAARSLDDEGVTGAAGIAYGNIPASMRMETPEDREAWTAFEKVPEVGTLVRGSANLASQVRLFIGIEVFENGQIMRKPLQEIEGLEPKFVADCEDALARYSDGAGRQASILRGLVENFQVTGRARLVGYVVDTSPGQNMVPVARDADGDRFQERWVVVSAGAVYRDQSIKTPGQPVPWRLQMRRGISIVLPQATVKEFLWPSSRYPDEASAWVLSCLDVCRDLRAFQMANRAAARSGIPADLFLVPSEASPNNLPAWDGDGVSQPGTNEWGPGGDGTVAQGDTAQDAWAVQVEALIGEFILGVLKDADSGNAAVPGVMTLEGRFITMLRKISFARPIDRGIAELSRDARTRIAESADAPPEMLRGLGKTNRWNGVQIADDEYRRYFKPKIEAVADGMTEVCWWPEMKARGYTVDQYRGYRVFADPSAIISSLDYGKIAPLALDRGAIGPKGFRILTGIPEDCAPTDVELAWMAMMRGKGGQSAGGGTGQGDGGAPGVTDVNQGLSLDRGSDIPQKILSADVTPPAANPLDGLGAELLVIEQAARARLEEACEAALDSVLEKAGGKLRNWARQAGGTAKELVDGTLVRTGAVATTLGPELCATLVADKLGPDTDRHREELFAAALVALLLSWRRIANDAYTAALATIGARASGTLPPEEVTAAILRSQDVLRSSMMIVAEDTVFGTGSPSTVGELSNLRVPTTVARRVMAVAGGNLGIGAGLEGLVDAALGLVFGPLLGRVLPPASGLQWVYGSDARRQNFEAHLVLDGKVYTSPTDSRLAGSPFTGVGPYYSPGDHRGCRCDWAKTWGSSTDG